MKNPQFTPSAELQQLLFGKALLLDELLSNASLLEVHHQHGYISYLPAITDNKKCNRCGTSEVHHFYSFPCSRCHKMCVYCRNCIMMGKSQSCTQLVTWTGPPLVFPYNPIPLGWDGQLSLGQQTASDKVVETIEQNGTCLVWAVCGAGKTEVLFHGIANAIAAGKRVCIATPRTDVVLELAPRIRLAFPKVKIAALYGNSEEKHECAQLVISTTHQLMRYQHAFDAIIVDEVDAFPYSMDVSLQYAVEKSRKSSSALILLTATPSQKLQKAAGAKKLPYVTIPARFHRYPLPIPRFCWTGNWKKQFQKNSIPAPLLHWYQEKLQNKTPFLIFFPNIELMNSYLPLFQVKYPELQAVYAEDPLRKEKVMKLRNQQTLGLLTTTILERGVTIARLHVAVIGAEEDIFTESALVQIAGRVGRSSEHPTGDIVFFHYGKTRAMVRAFRQICRMNNEARKRGLIDV